MILILRGHIRNSFENDNLYNLIKYLSENNQIEIYIHTWNIQQSNISWRSLDIIEHQITNEYIYKYFKDLSPLIKDIIIDDDTKIKIMGKTDGKVLISPCPLIGWKNYWYGKFQIINYLKNIILNNDIPIICMRFDIFNIPNNNNLSIEQIVQFINSNTNTNFIKNIFLTNYIRTGIDNIYMGNIYTMYKLINHFNTNLDQILLKEEYIKIYNQEIIVPMENNNLFE
jgi:hypothetical protein